MNVRRIILVILRGTACGVAFLTALVAVSLGLKQFLPFPEVPGIQPKLEHLRLHHADYDTIFIGSSRIYHQIVPELFDQLTSAEGIPTRSFNLAMDGMRPPEDSFVFDQFIQMRPQGLRWVFVELAGIRTAVDQNKRGTIRAVYWHDWERIRVMFRRALISKGDRRVKLRWEELREPLADFSDHLLLFAQNLVNFGRGNIWTERLITDEPRKTYWKLVGPRRDGFITTGRPEQMTEAERKNYETELAARKTRPAVPDYGDAVSQDLLGSMVSKIQQLGATPVLIVPPTTAKKNFYPSPERQAGLLILDFNDLQKYPELFASQYRLDPDHINTEGANIFTRYLVQRFTAAVHDRK